MQQERSNMKESDQDFGSKEKNKEGQSSNTQVFEPLPSINQFIFESMNVENLSLLLTEFYLAKTSVLNAKGN
jgi:hypothetical protein